jgi:DNA-binding beta-propeller fold protein YncE
MKVQRTLALAFALGCICLCPAGAQWLDTLLYFPDTLGSLTSPNQLLSNPLTGRVYGATEEDDIVVFDPATLQKARRFRGEFSGVAICPEPAKMYLVSPYEPQLAVVDVRADSFLRTVTLGEDYELFGYAYSPTSGKLYLRLENGDSGLAVLDVNNDSVVKWLLAGQEPDAIAWDSVHDRLYVAGGFDTTNMLVFDCATDSLIGGVTGIPPVDVCAAKPSGHKLYWLARDDAVYVVDTDSMWVSGRIALPVPAETLVYNPVYDRVYTLGQYSAFAVIDASADSVRRVLELPDDVIQMAVSPVDGRLYLATDSDTAVAIIDTTDTIVGHVRLDYGYGQALGFSAARRELYVGFSGGYVAVVDVPADTAKGYVDYRDFSIRNLIHNPAGNKLYLLMSTVNKVCVLGPDYRVLKYIDLALGTTAFPLLNPALNRLYIADRGTLTIIDCNTDSIVRTVGTGSIDDPIPVLHAGLNRLFIIPTDGATSALVYDCLRDSVIDSIPLGGEATCAAFQPLTNKLYVGVYANPNLTVIDPVRCTVLAHVRAGTRNRDNGAFGHPVNGLLYFVNAGPDSLYIFDSRNDSLLSVLPTVSHADTLFWNGPLDKLYLSYRYATSVLDCRTNTVIDSLPVGASRSGLMNEWSTKLFLGRSVLDCRNDTVIGTLAGIGTPYNFAWNPLDHRVFVTCHQAYLAVYDDEPVGIAEHGENAALQVALVSNPVRGRAVFRWQVPPGQTAVLSVMDILGRVVLRRRVQSPFGDSPSPSSLLLDLGSMRAGVYFARLETAGQMATAKFVLQR